jgi:hypothetical protein
MKERRAKLQKFKGNNDTIMEKLHSIIKKGVATTLLKGEKVS